VALTNLADQDAIQLVLPFERPYELDEALDRVRDRFGSAAIRRGVLIGRQEGPTVPMLED
jgi:DNA polymerase-4